jgi:hypothetical protein
MLALGSLEVDLHCRAPVGFEMRASLAVFFFDAVTKFLKQPRARSAK